MYLDGIVRQKREDVARRKEELPPDELKARVQGLPPPLDFAAALQGPGVRVIAEIKKASPSRGLLAPNLDPARLAQAYAAGGAAAISVLTEAPNFQGSLDHLLAVKKALEFHSPPLLRKDFIFDPYQVYESRLFRADAILLIVAILSDSQLQELLALSHRLGMECLVEVHSEEEVRRAVGAGARIIGINNRDLHTFKVDISTTRRLLPLVPKGHIAVSESGIRGREDVLRLREWGVNAFLVGEALVTAPDPGAKLRELLLAPASGP